MLHSLLFDFRVAAVFIVMLVVLVFAHEFGHYIFARLFGMGIEEFAIGFGRPRLGTYYRRTYRIPLTKDQAEAWERGEFEMPTPEGLPKALEPEPAEPGSLVQDGDSYFLEETTKFTIRAWPLGGFVRIKGSTPEEQGKETQVPGGFYSKAPWKRLIVLFAGPLFSVLAGMLILIPYGMVEGRQAFSHDPVLAVVQPDGPGYKGGLREGDRIVAVDGQPVSDFYQVVRQVTLHPEKPLAMRVSRAGQDLNLTVVPTLDDRASPVLGPDLLPTSDIAKQAKLHVGTKMVFVPVSLLAATKDALSVPILTVAGLAEGVLHPSTLKDQVGGPVAIVSATADATRGGVGQVVFMAGVLSVSLGIFNLLPIFPLDGGQMLVSFAEMLRKGRRLSMKAQSMVASVGFGALCMLVLGVLFIDFQRLHTSSSEKHVAAPKK